MTGTDGLVERLENDIAGVVYRSPGEGRHLVAVGEADLRALIEQVRTLQEDKRRMGEALVEACDAADHILAHVTAEVGRYVIEATDEDLVPMMAETGVQITAKMWRRLYEATDRAALNTGKQE